MNTVRPWIWIPGSLVLMAIMALVLGEMEASSRANKASMEAEVERKAKHDAEISALADKAVARARANVAAAEKEAAAARLEYAESTANLAKKLLNHEREKPAMDAKLAEVRELWARALAAAKTPEEKAEIKALMVAGELKIEEARKRFDAAEQQAREALGK